MDSIRVKTGYRLGVEKTQFGRANLHCPLGAVVGLRFPEHPIALPYDALNSSRQSFGLVSLCWIKLHPKKIGVRQVGPIQVRPLEPAPLKIRFLEIRVD